MADTLGELCPPVFGACWLACGIPLGVLPVFFVEAGTWSVAPVGRFFCDVVFRAGNSWLVLICKCGYAGLETGPCSARLLSYCSGLNRVTLGVDVYVCNWGLQIAGRPICPSPDTSLKDRHQYASVGS